MNLKMGTNIQYVKDLPAVNVDSSFLVLDYIKNDIEEMKRNDLPKIKNGISLSNSRRQRISRLGRKTLF